MLLEQTLKRSSWIQYHPRLSLGPPEALMPPGHAVVLTGVHLHSPCDWRSWASQVCQSCYYKPTCFPAFKTRWLLCLLQSLLLLVSLCPIHLESVWVSPRRHSAQSTVYNQKSVIYLLNFCQTAFPYLLSPIIWCYNYYFSFLHFSC